MSKPTNNVVCPYCEKSVRVNVNGRVRVHQSGTGRHCQGSGKKEGGMEKAPPSR